MSMSEESRERTVEIRSSGAIAPGSTGHLVLQPDRDGELVDLQIDAGAEITLVFAGKGTRFSSASLEGRSWREMLAAAGAPVRVRQGGYLTVVAQNVGGEDLVLSGRAVLANEAEPRAETAAEPSIPEVVGSSSRSEATESPGKRRFSSEDDGASSVSPARAEQLLRPQIAPREGQGVVGLLRVHAEAIRTWLADRIPMPSWARTTIGVMIDTGFSSVAQPEGDNEVVLALEVADAEALRDHVLYRGSPDLDPAVAARVLRAVRYALDRSGAPSAPERPALPAGPDVITVEVSATA